MQKKTKPISGYIEGYYGRLLNWTDRERVLSSLKKNKMSFYFYAPKEDNKHRVDWKKKYNSSWEKNFKNFSKTANQNKINIIFGISPGLDFDFIDFIKKKSKKRISKDLRILHNKVSQILELGNVEIGLLFDDLPNNFKDCFGAEYSEGRIHAELTNSLFNFFNKSIYVVPRIYANELVSDDNNYLLDFGNSINKENKTFYSGENIVSKSISKTLIKKISKIIPTEIIIWDNLYANDYCPRRLFLGPYKGRETIKNIMINPTGLIETDLLILDIVKATQRCNNKNKIWKKIINNQKIPINFYSISKYFMYPDYGTNPSLKNFIFSNAEFEDLEYLLWKWKTPLSREWFSYLLGLKHDLELNQNLLPCKRIIKTQTLPLARYLI